MAQKGIGKIMDSKIIFGTTIEHGGRCEKEQPKVGPKGEGVASCSESYTARRGTTESNGSDLNGWAEKRSAMPGQAKLALCFQTPSQASLHGILKPHRPFCYANGPTLSSVFSTTNPAFAQRINPVLFGLPIRVYLGNPRLKNLI